MNGMQTTNQTRRTGSHKSISNGNGAIKSHVKPAEVDSDPPENIFMFYPNIIGIIKRTIPISIYGGANKSG